MRILLVNPNSTASMTEKAGACAVRFAAAGTEIRAVNPVDAPVSIEGYHDEAMCLRGMLGEIRRGEAEGYQGFVIACFDDTGLGAAREVATGPVLGICEAGMHAASMLANRFSVVTTLPRSIPIIEDLALLYGMDRKCRKVRAADVPVLALEDETSGAREKVLAEIRRAVAEDGSEAILLGCAGMADLAAWLSAEAGIPVIDGVVSAVKMVEALIGAGYKTSKVGGYAAPRVK